MYVIMVYMRQQPKIDIKYGNFLDPIFLKCLASDPRNEGRIPPAKEEVLEKIEKYKKEWVTHEEKIVSALQETLELDFAHNIIDIYVVTASRGSFSDPVVISSKFTPEVFIDILTHELIHRLLSENTESVAVGKILLKILPDENNMTRVHVLLHAVHKHIYLNTLKEPERLTANLMRSDKFPNYKKAWKIVEDFGYQELIEKVKSFY